ncbi:hypothetical protein NKH77_54775 [Streptomyces sp. M19]
MALNLALQQAGMTMKDISKVVMDAPTIVSAFASGQIDGAGIWYPLIDTIKEKVPGMTEVASTQKIGGTFPPRSSPAPSQTRARPQGHRGPQGGERLAGGAPRRVGRPGGGAPEGRPGQGRRGRRARQDDDHGRAGRQDRGRHGRGGWTR